MGRVVATIESSGKRQTAGTTILKLRPVPVKPSDLEYHLSMLMAAYSDPIDIVRVAQDLASRCRAKITPTLPSEPQEPVASKDSKGARRSKSPKQPKKGEPKDELVAQILSSKFVLDSWCLKYKDFVMQNMAGVPKTTDGKKLFLLLEGELDKTVELVLTPSSIKASWVMNLKCPFMRDFVNPDLRKTAREGMFQYALSRRSLSKRLGRKLRSIGNFFSKKFTWKRKSSPGAAANNEWAIINVGTGIWDSTRHRFEHTLTFRPENMSCGKELQRFFSATLWLELSSERGSVSPAANALTHPKLLHSQELGKALGGL
ncbi:hypothetical protein, conserved [Eimeria necatrix]|uniref:Uncharacterized protein n=1 Tax=Eimeria necatrix TaxID=51315 RepID=U6MXI0_9EIME|nr:hypothetical protein, conserved [Eimeria necatrix]CDJ68962.1 hypothetical protein, conserved [Eimeria necatrix]